MIRNFRELAEFARSGELPGTTQEIINDELLHMHGTFIGDAIELAAEMPELFSALPIDKNSGGFRQAEYTAIRNLECIRDSLKPATRKVVALFDVATNSPISINKYIGQASLGFHYDIGLGSIVAYPQDRNIFDYMKDALVTGEVARREREGDYFTIYPEPGDLVLIGPKLMHRGRSKGERENPRYTMAQFLPSVPSEKSINDLLE